MRELKTGTHARGVGGMAKGHTGIYLADLVRPGWGVLATWGEGQGWLLLRCGPHDAVPYDPVEDVVIAGDTCRWVRMRAEPEVDVEVLEVWVPHCMGGGFGPTSCTCGALAELAEPYETRLANALRELADAEEALEDLRRQRRDLGNEVIRLRHELRGRR